MWRVLGTILAVAAFCSIAWGLGRAGLLDIASALVTSFLFQFVTLLLSNGTIVLPDTTSDDRRIEEGKSALRSFIGMGDHRAQLDSPAGDDRHRLGGGFHRSSCRNRICIRDLHQRLHRRRTWRCSRSHHLRSDSVHRALQGPANEGPDQPGRARRRHREGAAITVFTTKLGGTAAIGIAGARPDRMRYHRSRVRN